MGEGPLYRVPFRRRREGRTDYRTRLALLKSEKPRVVVRRSLRNVTVQFIAYDEQGDQVVAQAQATELKKLGWNGFTSNVPAAYLTGLLAGKRFLETNPEAAEDGHAVLDIGRAVPVKGGRIFAALAGALEAGVKIPHGEILPTDDRIRGEHLQGKAETAGAEFGATYTKITGKPLPPKKEAPKKKGDKKGAAPAPAAGKPGAKAPKPAGGAPKGEGQAKGGKAPAKGGAKTPE